MKLTSIVVFGALCATASTLTEASKCGKAWQQCGKKDGFDNCCENGYYCQPWDSGNVQCQATPAKCEKLETNVDFYGNDIKTLYSVQPGDCCSACAATKDCNAFTFINHRAGPSACYLKRTGTNKKYLEGAVSGYIKGGKQASRSFVKQMKASNCKTAPWSKCGNEQGTTCCVDGQYCQPYNPGFYQCMKTPDGCPYQYTDVDFFGEDIGKARAGTNDECCNACKANKACKAYTFVNHNNDGPQCYLKRAPGSQHTGKKGAVSGIVG